MFMIFMASIIKKKIQTLSPICTQHSDIQKVRSHLTSVTKTANCWTIKIETKKMGQDHYTEWIVTQLENDIKREYYWNHNENNDADVHQP
jgi:hypothetical protein